MGWVHSGDSNNSVGMLELDSHENMICMDKQAMIIQETGQSMITNSFSEDVGVMPRVPIIDAMVAYNFLHSDRVLMVERNTLHIQSMDHNLTPPFILC